MSALAQIRRHAPEYAIEAAGLALFLVAAVGMTILLEHPEARLHHAIESDFARRVLMGLAMGATAIALVHSPPGRRSGAHFNPALTFTFWRLGKIETIDALGYAIAQTGGALAGVAAIGLVLGEAAHPAVRFAVTRPGAPVAAAFAAEVAISFGLMATVLVTSNHPRLAPWTGCCAGALVALYIAFEAPISGMSMNPARTLGSAASAGVFDSLWIYFTAPPLGMLLAAEAYLRLGRARRVYCAKLDHRGPHRCIFRCEQDELGARSPRATLQRVA